MSTSSTPSRLRTSRRGLHLLVVAVTAVALGLAALPAGAVTQAAHDDSSNAAAHWTAAQVGDDGAVGQGFSGPVGNAIQAALALAAAEQGGDAFDRAVGYVQANYDSYVHPDDTDLPGPLAYTILLADAAGLDPTNFGTGGNESDLVARLQATKTEDDGQPEDGRFGVGTEFDRVFNHGLALLALDAAGVAPDQDAIDWLTGQQCPDGGWPAYRTPEDRTADTCANSAPDSNSTAVATQAVEALEVMAPHDPLAWFADNQNDDGGWGFSPAFGATDTNSTALVIQALVAAGEDPDAGPWVRRDLGQPFTALRALQLGCEAEPADRGAFAFQPDEEGGLSANAATFAALQGVEHLPYPFGDRTGAMTAGTSGPECPALISDRDGGADRIETASLLARDGFPGGTSTVVIAYAYGYADALAGAPLAAQQDAPTLLTETDRLPDVVAETINDLGATSAIVLGGRAVVSDAVVQQLQERTTVDTVDRVDGANRFDTAAKIAERVGGDTVYVTEGQDADPARGWPDALAVSGLAAAQGRAILLVTTEVVPPETDTALDGKAAAIIVGGDVAVSPAVAAKVDEDVGTVTRVAGTDRYRTALALTRLARQAGLAPDTTWFTTGNTYPDALAAGPIVARSGDVLMLVDSGGLERSPGTSIYIHEVNLALDVIRLVGGGKAIPPEVAGQLFDAAR